MSVEESKKQAVKFLRENGIGEPVGQVFDLLHALTGSDRFVNVLLEAMDLLKRKNSDYRGAGSSPISHFRGGADEIGIPIEKLWAVYARKHWHAILSYARDGRVESEPVRERIKDLINYLVILSVIVEDKETK